MPRRQRHLQSIAAEIDSRVSEKISRKRVLYSMGRFCARVHKRQYRCIINEGTVPEEEFKRDYLDPLKRIIDLYLSAAKYWIGQNPNLVTPTEYASIQALWQRVDKYIQTQ